MAGRRKLPDKVRAAIFDKLDILAAHGFTIEALSAYQYRINSRIDIYPVNRRWHDIRRGVRGDYFELISFIQNYDMTTEPTNEELAAASGEARYRAPRPLDLNQVSINGDADAIEVDGKLERKGGYFRKHVLLGKPRDQKPEEVNIGKVARVVLLKIRRKLVERGEKGKVLLSTDEHNDKRDAVTLYVADTKEQKRGTAEDLRIAYPGLRTVQIVYALLLGEGEPELVRLIVKGSALGSDAKKQSGGQDFYQYVSSFPKQDHMWEYETELHPVIEQGAKSYYTIDFRRGRKLDDDTLSLAKRTLLDVALNCKEVDAARAAKFVGDAKAESEPVQQGRSEADFQEEGPGIEYPKDDINPDDIPFRYDLHHCDLERRQTDRRTGGEPGCDCRHSFRDGSQ